MRKMTLLLTAVLLTTAAVSTAHAAKLPPQQTCWVLVCDSNGVCWAEEIFC